MAGVKFTNFASTTIATAVIAPGDLSFSVAAATGNLFPTIVPGEWFYIVLVDVLSAPTKREVVKVTARSVDVMTVVRAQEGTTAQSWIAGNFCACRATNQGLIDLITTTASTVYGSLSSALVSFIQAGIGAITRSVQAKARDIVSVKDFGALGDGITDDTAALNLAIASCISGGTALYLPGGIYKISSLITVSGNICIRGDGVWKTYILQSSAVLGGIYFDPNYAAGGGLSDISIHAVSTNPGQTKSSGIGLKVTRANGVAVFRNIDINGFATGIQSYANFYTFFQDFQVLNASTAALHSPIKTGGGGFLDSAGVFWRTGKVSNFGTASINTSSTGILVESSSGDFYDDIDVTVFNQGVVVKPAVTAFCNFIFFQDVLADSSISDGWTFDSVNGSIYTISLTDCWAAFSSAGQGVKINGPTTEGLKWIGGNIRENFLSGLQLNGGKALAFIGVDIAQNGKQADNTLDGVVTTTNAATFSARFVGCSIGNFSSGLATRQRYGINVGATFAGNLEITGNDLSNNQTAPVINNSSGGNVVLNSNLPVQSGVAKSSGEIIHGCAIGTMAAGLTRYLGVNGLQTAESDTYIAIGRTGQVTRMFIAITPPGAGQTLTATFRQNGVDTALTGSATGGAAFSIDLFAPTINIAAGDYCSIKMVSSAGAAASTFRYFIDISG